MLFRKCGCLVVHGKCIFRKCFSVLMCLWCKLISVFILPSNTIFRKTERERVCASEIAPARKERERERKNPKNSEEPNSDRPRRTPKPIVLDPDCRPRLRRWIVLDPDRHPQSRRTPKPIVLDPDRRPRSRSRLRADRDHSTNRFRTISSLVEPSRYRIMNFFFSGFYLCFWVLFVFGS